jgi:opacity protein-like surface antigen
MKKLIVAVLAFLPFSSVFAQTPAIKLPGKVALGLVFSPDRCYRTLTTTNADVWGRNMRDDLEIPKFGFTAGGSVIFSLGNQVSLESGLLLSDKGEQTKDMVYYTPYPEPHAPASGKHNYHYLYLDVPAKVNYYIPIGKFRTFVSAGTSANIFIAEKRTSVYTFSDGHTESRKVNLNSGFSKINIAALAGAGVEYDLTEKCMLRVEPIYRRSITSVIDEPIKGYLYSAGVNFGVFMKL